MSDSLVMDTAPRFPIPNDLVHHFTNGHHFDIHSGIITAWHAHFPHLADIAETLQSVARMAQHINDTTGSTRMSLWRDEEFMVRYFQPILHDALSLRRVDLNQPHLLPEVVIQEAARLSCLIFLSSMNRKFRLSLDGVMIYRAEVMKLLIRHPVAWSFFLDLRLWVLVIGGLVAEHELRAWHIDEISSTMEQLGLTSWNAAHSIIKRILWVENLLDEEAERLGFEIEEFMRQKQV